MSTALSTEAFRQIEALLTTAGPVVECIAELRRAFPGLSFTRCDASDLGSEVPVLETPRFSLYLVDAHDHCARITTDLARATGLVLAEKR